jgi:hypothetical protein
MLNQLKNPPYLPLFSHQAPCSVWLPGSEFFLTFYPAYIEILLAETQKVVSSFSLNQNSHFLTHTISLDILHQCITIEGETKVGFQRICFCCENQAWVLRVQKREFSFLDETGASHSYQRGESRPLFSGSSYAATGARLVLTSPKKNRWEQLLDRGNWMSILEQVYVYPGREIVKETITESHLNDLILKGFSGLLVPTIGEDVLQKYGHQFWSFLQPEHTIANLQAMIRSLFLKEENKTLFLLPSLPPSCLSGQVIREKCFNNSVSLSFDWRKGRMRRLFLQAEKDFAMQLHVPHCSGYRLRVWKQKGVHMEKSEAVLCLEKGKQYILDNFA